MQRYSSRIQKLAGSNSISNSVTVSSSPALPGSMSIFGGGKVRTYVTSGSYSFIVPAGITSIRLRVLGAGGGLGLNGGSSSVVGTGVSISGGGGIGGGATNGGAGGSGGTGGDFRAVGGAGGNGAGNGAGGGGGPGSALGAGGRGGNGNSTLPAGGGGGGPNQSRGGDASNSRSGAGASAISDADGHAGGFDMFGQRSMEDVIAPALPDTLVIRFPGDGYPGAGAKACGNTTETLANRLPTGPGGGGSGAAGTVNRGSIGNFAGGGGGGGPHDGGPGGYGGGVGGGSSSHNRGGGGGGEFAYGVFTVTPADVLTVTVGANGSAGDPFYYQTASGGEIVVDGGLVIIEW